MNAFAEAMKGAIKGRKEMDDGVWQDRDIRFDTCASHRPLHRRTSRRALIACVAHCAACDACCMLHVGGERTRSCVHGMLLYEQIVAA